MLVIVLSESIQLIMVMIMVILYILGSLPSCIPVNARLGEYLLRTLIILLQLVAGAVDVVHR